MFSSSLSTVIFNHKGQLSTDLILLKIKDDKIKHQTLIKLYPNFNLCILIELFNFYANTQLYSLHTYLKTQKSETFHFMELIEN
ncbi:hypothetical protein Hanom_Chr17g01545181 [Helianthus anomalus]